MKPEYSIVMQGNKKNMAQGVPMATMTTNTLTPTTLRNITQIFESEECLGNLQKYEESGGFEPPTVLPVITAVRNSDNTATISLSDSFLNLVPASTESATSGLSVRSSFANMDCKNWHGGCTTVVTPSKCLPAPIMSTHSDEDDDTQMYQDDDKDEDYEPEMKMSNTVTRKSSRKAAPKNTTPTTIASASDRAPKRKSNKGGRKPAGSSEQEENNLTPVEKKKLTVRRERNKEAAARCRGRRMDLTNKLSGEVEVWEGKKKSLEEEIRMLTSQREELEFVLQAHSQVCKLQQQGATRYVVQQQPIVVAVKSEPMPVVTMASAISPVIVEPVNAPYILPSQASKPHRPFSLSLNQPKAVSPKVEGVDIETPSTIVPTICFDSIVSTGLTPSGYYNSILTPLGATTPLLNTPTCSRQHQAHNRATMAENESGIASYLQL
jgi:hypothetical protein